ncbi:glutaredoxin [Thermococcus eurythermalis]|uniref:Glutaredoxin n=1 Tax=Thermococcus eurythermalis TaxID=1505907 RepID=A0A097QV32_9EURY|nr:thioredoxin family protein [Thermococcus eurythermalis]AIU70335.1 glutaredoxin [Thermococcus eurythermalis]
MKKVGVLLLLLFLIGFSAGCIGSDNTDTTSSTSTAAQQDYVDVNGTKIYLDKVHFYMYGAKTCPHCRNMKEKIPAKYGEEAFTYYELVNNQTNMELFNQLAQLTGITGVPAIAIAYNGTLYAVIEGEFDVEKAPEIIATAMENNGVFLIVGKVYLLPRDEPKWKLVIDALHTLFVEHEPVDVQEILDQLKANSTSAGNSTG